MVFHTRKTGWILREASPCPVHIGKVLRVIKWRAREATSRDGRRLSWAYAEPVFNTQPEIHHG